MMKSYSNVTDTAATILYVQYLDQQMVGSSEFAV